MVRPFYERPLRWESPIRRSARRLSLPDVAKGLVGPLFIGIVVVLSWVTAVNAQDGGSEADSYANEANLSTDGATGGENLLQSEKIIYGVDNRRDIYEETDPDLLRLSEIVCLVVSKSLITDNDDGTYYLHGAATWRRIQGLPICPTEPFVGQLQLGFCSGFLVGDDLVATAGHCVGPTDRSASGCSGAAFIFDYEQVGLGDPPSRLISEDQVYFCSEIVEHALIQDRDYAVIRLDRPVLGRSPLPLRREGTVSVGDPLVLISHPAGLPKKIADNATVKDPRPTSFLFDADLDYLGGSSGGMIANLNDFTIEGILSSGPALDDYVAENGCVRTRQCSTETGCPGFAGICKTSGFLQSVPDILSSRGVIVLDRSRYNPESTLQIVVRDKDLKGAATLQIMADTSEGDSEPIDLLERPSGSGVFEGTAQTQPLGEGLAEKQVGDGYLQARHGSEVTLRYLDEDIGTGVPMSVDKIVPIDGEPPVLSGLQVVSVGGTFAALAFTADEPVRTAVPYTAAGAGSDCSQFNQIYRDGNLSESVAVTLKRLAPNREYHFEVQITDEAGNTATENNGGADCHSFITTERIDQLTELFSQGDNDLQNLSLQFAPNDSVSSYEPCISPATEFFTDPQGGEVLALNDDDSREVILAGAGEIPFFGLRYKNFFVGSNGTLSFGEPDSSAFESLGAHFRLPRVSALFRDLVPEDNVSWKQTSDRVAITYEGVREFETNARNSFQAEFFFDGSIRITYLQVETTRGLVGLSQGKGLLPDFLESDFAAKGTCQEPPTATPTFTQTPTAAPTPLPTWANARNDISGDGVIDARDLLVILADWKKVSGP